MQCRALIESGTAPAVDSRGLSAVEPCCKTRFRNAHRTVCRELLYQLHPWLGRTVFIHGAIDKGSSQNLPKRKARPVCKSFCVSAHFSLLQRIRLRGMAKSQDGDPRSPVLIIVPTLSAILGTRFPGCRSTVGPSRIHHSQTSSVYRHVAPNDKAEHDPQRASATPDGYAAWRRAY